MAAANKQAKTIANFILIGFLCSLSEEAVRCDAFYHQLQLFKQSDGTVAICMLPLTFLILTVKYGSFEVILILKLDISHLIKVFLFMFWSLVPNVVAGLMVFVRNSRTCAELGFANRLYRSYCSRIMS